MEDAVDDIEMRPIGARAPDVQALRRQNFSRRALIWGGTATGLVLAGLFMVRVFGGSAKKHAAPAPVAASKAVTSIEDGEIQTTAKNGVAVGKDSALTAQVPVTGDSLVFRAPPQSATTGTGDPRMVGGNVGTSALPGGTADGLQLAGSQPSRTSQSFGGDTPVPRFNTTSPARSSGGGAATQENVPPDAPHILTRSERFTRIKGSLGLGDGGTGTGDSPFSGRRSALAGGDVSEATATGAPVQFVPGTRVRAIIHTPTPSATSGEPIEAVLDGPLVNRGRIVAPAGTRAIGKGTMFDDGTGNDRLLITFTQFVLPDDRVLTMTGMSYSISDNRPGISVPVNRQLARKGTRLGLATGLAYGVGRMADKITGGAQQSEFVQPSVGQQVAGQALQDAYNQAHNELGLQAPSTGVVLSLPADQPLLIVFGLGQNQ
jgi:hypothetical protein